MAEVTGIGWCDSTANLWKGCQRVSPACDNCYAETLVCGRLQGRWGPHADRTFVKAGWALIKKFQRRAAKNGGIDPDLGRKRRIFVNSLADFFDNHRSIVWRDDAWNLIANSPDLIFILVTKRPENISRMLPSFWGAIADRCWIVVTAEDQINYDRRTSALRKSFTGHAWPAVFGVSFEPLLEPIQIDRFSTIYKWFIAGSESGSKRRHTDLRWIYDIRQAARHFSIAFFAKQIPSGNARPTTDLDQFPEPIRVQEWPR